MKKLLTILGSLTVTVGASASVVACGQKENNNTRTGSVFLDNDGNLKIDTDALVRWYIEHNGIGIGNEELKEFLQLFAVGIMKEAEKGTSDLFDDIIPSSTEHQYAIEDFKKIIKEKWGTKETKDTTTVQGAAQVAWDKKVDETKRRVGDKKWKQSLIDELTATFPYVKKEFEALKNAFISNEILANKDNSALAILTKTLTKNYSKDFLPVVTDSETLTTTFYNNWKSNRVSEIAEKIFNYVKNKMNRTKPEYLNIVNLINATGGKNPTIATKANSEDKWKISDIDWLEINDDISENLVNDLMHRLNENYETEKADPTVMVNNANFKGSYDVSNKWQFADNKGDWDNTNNFFDLVDKFPNPDFKSSLSNDDAYGWLNNSQKFVVDQYFKNQKPVSISEIVFKKTSDLEQNITGQNFISPSTVNNNEWTQFYGLYDFLKNYVMETGTESAGITTQIKGTSQYNFDTIFGNWSKEGIGKILLNGFGKQGNVYATEWKTEFYDAKNDGSLLTLSDTTHSNILKYSIYDFLQAKPEETAKVYKLDTNPSGGSSETNNIAETLLNNYGYTDSRVAENIQYGVKSREGSSTLPDVEEVKGSLYASLNLIEKLNRKIENNDGSEYSTSDKQENNKVYQVLNSKQGIIAFIDTDGLHITKINGYDILKNGEITEQKSNLFHEENNESNYINQNNAFTRLDEYYNNDNSGKYRYIYQDYNNQIGKGEETDEFAKQLVDPDLKQVNQYGVSYDDLNKSITNPYERFLVNNSILSGKPANEDTPAFYKFDLMKEAFASISENSENELSMNNSWLWDYIKNLLDSKLEEDKNKEQNKKKSKDLLLIERFFKFEEKEEWLAEWYEESLGLNTTHTNEASLTNFKSGWDSWNQAIDKTKNGDEDRNKNLPLVKLDYGNLKSGVGEEEFSHLDNIADMQEFEPFIVPAVEPLTVYSFEITIGNYSSSAIGQNKKGGHN